MPWTSKPTSLLLVCTDQRARYDISHNISQLSGQIRPLSLTLVLSFNFLARLQNCGIKTSLYFTSCTLLWKLVNTLDWRNGTHADLLSLVPDNKISLNPQNKGWTGRLQRRLKDDWLLSYDILFSFSFSLIWMHPASNCPGVYKLTLNDEKKSAGRFLFSWTSH